MISIVDYGVGNVQAFLNVYKRLNIEAETVETAGDLEGATKLILPGVGFFDHAMKLLAQSGMRERLDDLVSRKGIPVLGVCVGMQMFAVASDEGTLPGLGWIEGRVKRLDLLEPSGELQLPHMGWNDVRPVAGNRLFDQLEPDPRFYFLHSYYLECEQQDDVAAVSTYGKDFACAVTSGNIYGVQFHPEKSHHFGTRLLRNFAEL
jgi:glutamine amidotransferase